MATNDKNNSSNNKYGRDPNLILDYKNFAVNAQRFKNQMVLKYELAGKILELRTECRPELDPEDPVEVADIDNPTPAEQRALAEAAELRKYELQTVVKNRILYKQQKEQLAVEIIVYSSNLLRLALEKDASFKTIKTNPLQLWLLVEQQINLGDNFSFRELVKQIIYMAGAKMNEKSSLDSFTHNFTVQFEKLFSMMVKLKIDDVSQSQVEQGDDDEEPTVALMSVEKFISKLIAAFFIEALPKSFGDEIRKDISNEKKIDVEQPDTLQEAVALANNYYNLKPESLNTVPGNNGGKGNSGEKLNPVVGAVGPTKNDKVVYSDPNKPPPKPWSDMAYCTHCKKWGRHTVDNCFNKNKEKEKNKNIPGKSDDKNKEKGKKNPKVGAATNYEDEAAVWGSSVK